MSIIVKRASEYETSIWSGGKTTEMCIFPPESIYQEQDFGYRISSATITNERSTFTSLPKYQRILMVLEGEIELQHIETGKPRTVTLKEGEQDSFSGANETTSIGQCTDYNLIYQPNYEGEIKHIIQAEEWTLQVGEDVFIYAFNELAIAINNEAREQTSMVLSKGDSLHIHSEDTPIRLSIKCSDKQGEIQGLKTLIRK